MKKSTKAILIGSGFALTGAAAIASAVSYKTTKTLVNTALDRELPKAMKNKRIYKKETDEALLADLKEKSERLKNSGCETVEITGSDGKKLIGHCTAGVLRGLQISQVFLISGTTTTAVFFMQSSADKAAATVTIWALV